MICNPCARTVPGGRLTSRCSGRSRRREIGVTSTNRSCGGLAAERQSVRRRIGDKRVRLCYEYLLLSALLIPACGSFDPCGDQIIAEAPSPGGEYRAIVFERDCGATTEFSTQVSVLRRNEGFRAEHTWLRSSSGANCFTCDSDHGKAAGGAWGGPWVDVRWVSGDRLEVRYDERARVFRHESRVSGVAVTLVPSAPPEPTGRNVGGLTPGVQPAVAVDWHSPTDRRCAPGRLAPAAEWWR